MNVPSAVPWWRPIARRRYLAAFQWFEAGREAERSAHNLTKLALIEAQNPGIDIERVRAERGWD